MRLLREILRLRYAGGLSQRAIARCLSIGLGTVCECLAQAAKAGLNWPQPAELDDTRLGSVLAVMRPATRRLLARLARRYPCVVISGRTRVDVIRRVGKTGVRTVIGDHGMEPWHAPETPRRDARLWARILRQRLERWRGVAVEKKRYSVSVHYRDAQRKREARAAVLRAAATLRPVRLIGGKDLVNVLPRGAPHKGVCAET
jgi:trehalose-phosphatase